MERRLLPAVLLLASVLVHGAAAGPVVGGPSVPAGVLWEGLKPELVPLLLEKLAEADPVAPSVLPGDAKDWLKDDAAGKTAAGRLADCEKALAGRPPEERLAAMDRAREDLARGLRERMTRRKAVTWSPSARLQRDANVTQTPDGEQSVSDHAGTSLVTGLGVKLDGRRRSWGAPSLQLAAQETDYLDDAFDNRFSRNATITVTDAYEVGGAVHLLTPKLAFRRDWLKPAGSVRAAFDTWTPGLSAMCKPKPKPCRFSDLLVGVLVADLELRGYAGSDRLDAAGRSKDTLTPSLTAVALSMKKAGAVPTRQMLILNLRPQSSDSADQEYDTGRLGLSCAFELPQATLTPDLAFTLRRQDVFQGTSRRDTGWELGLAAERAFLAKRLVAGLSGRLVKQDSSQAAFTFSNTQFAASLQCQL